MTIKSEFSTRAECEEQTAGPPLKTKSRFFPPYLGDTALALGALVYVVLALFDGMDSPLVGLVVILVVGHRLFRPHYGGRGT